MVFKIKRSWPLAILVGTLGLILDAQNASAQDSRGDSGRVDSSLGEQSKQPGSERLQYIRQTLQDNGEPKALQTAITRFKNKDGASVDLIGAVHIGNASYYELLNELFSDYDVVLYELVAPEDHEIPKPGRKSNNPLSFLQNSAQKMLGLSSQLEGVDYSPSNFVHADLSPQQMQEKMAERGQTGISLAMEAFSEMMSKQSSGQGLNGSGGEEISFSELIDTFNSPYKMRRMMAAQFATEDLEIGLGQSLNQLLVVDRNKAAMKVLDEQLNDGNKKIGIFYGAAHMPDFEQRLEKINFKYASQSWVDAWDLRKTAEDERGSELSPLMEMLKEFSK